jgi:ssDNA-binding Zn-finger/Zn-ribbon topoisomerase 1
VPIRAKHRKRYKLVPCALAPDGQVISPEEAVRGNLHRCPECNNALSLRLSKLQNPYFAHTTKAKCKLEHSSVVLAKHVLHWVLTRWIKGNGDPVEVQPFCEKRYELPREEIHQIKLNHSIRIYPKRTLHSHLSLLDRHGYPILHIEIRDKPRIRHIKHPSWLEVSAEEVLSNPYLLSSLNPHMNFSTSMPTQLNLFDFAPPYPSLPNHH